MAFPAVGAVPSLLVDQWSWAGYTFGGGATQAYRTVVTADSPVSYYRLGERSGTAVSDVQGANPGSYVGSQSPNLVTNPSFEADALNAAPAGWGQEASAGSSISVFSVSNGWSSSGAKSLRVTGSAAATTGYFGALTPTGTSGYAVTPNATYSFRAAVNALNVPASSQIQLVVFWYTSAGAYISTSYGSNVTATGTTTLTAAGLLAPANAAFGAVDVRASTTAGTAQTIDYYIDAVQVTQTTTVQPYSDTQGVTLAQTGALAGDTDTAVLLDGQSGYVSVPDSTGLRLTAAGLTLEAWVKPTDRAVYYPVIDKGNEDYSLWLNVSDGRPYFQGNLTLIATSAPPVGVWSHIAVTYDGANVRHYLNGAPNGVIANTAAIASTATPLRLGNAVPAGGFFKGTLDEVAVYNTALTPARILAHYTTGTTGAKTADPFGIQKIEGIDMQSVRTGDAGRLRDHGAFIGLDLMGARDITITGQLLTTGTNWQTFANVMAPGGTTETPLYFNLPGWGTLAVMARIRRHTMPRDLTASLGNLANVTIQFACTDPRIYVTPTQGPTVGLPIPNAGFGFPLSFNFQFGGGGTVGVVSCTNSGNVETRPILKITGPVNTPSVTNATAAGSPTLTFGLSLNTGDVLTVDTDMHTATLTTAGSTVGSSRLSTLQAGSQWWTLAPGVNQIQFASTDQAQVAGTLEVDYASAWII